MADQEGAVASEAPLKRRPEDLLDAAGSKRLRPDQITEEAAIAYHPDEGLQAVTEDAAAGPVAAAEASRRGKGVVEEDDDDGTAEVEGEICDGLKVEDRQALKKEAVELNSPKAGRAEEMEGEGEGEGEVVQEEGKLEGEGNAGDNDEDDEAASELDAEEGEEDDDDSESDEDEEDEEDSGSDTGSDSDAGDESKAQEGSSAKGKAKVDIKGKGIVQDTGKGKAKLEDEEVIDEEEAGYLSEDALEEVDLNNILPSRTRRRNAGQPTFVDTTDLGDDEDDEDYHGE